MHRPFFSVVVLTSLLALGATAPDADDFETPPVLRAADVAPESLRKGEGFHVEDAVPTDGLTTRFRLVSDVGTFEAHGVETLALRVSELPALRALAKASKTDTFTHALAETAKRPVKAAAQMVTHPVETAKGIPSGLGRFFDRVESGGKRLYATVTDERSSGAQRTKDVAKSTGQIAVDTLGYEQELRMLAKQLGVDPYTTNPQLAAKLAEFAKVAFYGRVGLNTLISVVVPASLIITGTRATRDLVYDTPRGDLIVRNETALRAMGVTDATLRALQRTTGFTLSVQTELVQHLESLANVKGRPAVVALAATAATTDQALFLVRGVRMLAESHAQHPLVEIGVAGTIFGRGADGALIVPAAVDYVAWIARVARFAQRADLTAAQREVHLTGRMSARARSGFEAIGWRIVEDAR